MSTLVEAPIRALRIGAPDRAFGLHPRPPNPRGVMHASRRQGFPRRFLWARIQCQRSDALRYSTSKMEMCTLSGKRSAVAIKMLWLSQS